MYPVPVEQGGTVCKVWVNTVCPGSGITIGRYHDGFRSQTPEVQGSRDAGRLRLDYGDS